MVTPELLRFRARRLRDLIEPIAGAVYFLPETNERYAALGFGPRDGVTPPASYFCSRGACMGQVPGEVVTSAFGVFSPALVIPAVTQGWTVTSAAAVLDARLEGTEAGLSRILGAEPAGAGRATDLLNRGADAASIAGHALYAGLRSLPVPASTIGKLFRACDVVREHRGDSHIAAWVGQGLDAVEAQVLQELWWRRPIGPYTLTRGWSEADVEAAVARLQAQRIIGDDRTLTPHGEVVRGQVEDATDLQERSIVEALGDDADELFAILEPMADAAIAAKAYPSDPRKLTRY